MQNSRIKFKPISLLLLATLTSVLLLSGCGPLATEPEPIDSSPTLPPTTVPATDVAPSAEPPTGEPTPQDTQPIQNVEVLPDATDYKWEVIAQGLNTPVYLTHAGDGSGRLFVVEKAGRIVVMVNGEKLPEPFLDISSQVRSKESERGLLGLAFHPAFNENGYFFVYYTDLQGNSVVSRYQVVDQGGNADHDSELVLLQVQQPYPNHNGGMLAFSPDGYLYIGLGDGGRAGDPQGNAQNLNTLLGKILRIDVNNGNPYGIPPSNPLAGQNEGQPEILAYGLRNPWRFSFDRATGDLFIGDVGQHTWEEVSILPSGNSGLANLGWDYYEGNHPYEGTPPQEETFIFPVLEYSHSDGGCSITGGYVYRGQQLPEWQGVYLFGDYCMGIIWGAIPESDGLWQAVQMFRLPVALASFGEDEAGELYFVDLNGNVYRLTNQ